MKVWSVSLFLIKVCCVFTLAFIDSFIPAKICHSKETRKIVIGCFVRLANSQNLLFCLAQASKHITPTTRAFVTPCCCRPSHKNTGQQTTSRCLTKHTHIHQPPTPPMCLDTTIIMSNHHHEQTQTCSLPSKKSSIRNTRTTETTLSPNGMLETETTITCSDGSKEIRRTISFVRNENEISVPRIMNWNWERTNERNVLCLYIVKSTYISIYR
jgi:hypothetical protein